MCVLPITTSTPSLEGKIIIQTMMLAQQPPMQQPPPLPKPISQTVAASFNLQEGTKANYEPNSTHQQGAEGYTFSSEPRAVQADNQKKKLYRDNNIGINQQSNSENSRPK